MSGKPCVTCPFRRDVRPFLTPKRAMGIAFATRRKDGVFLCHKTIKYGRRNPKKDATMCVGFALMRAQEAGDRFITEEDGIYRGMGDMIMAYVRENA